MNNKVNPFTGYLFCTPYKLEDNAVFKSKKDEDNGEDQVSKVLAVSPKFVDAKGELADMEIKKGDIIIHSQSFKEIKEGGILYRFIHISECHGKLNAK